MTEVTNGNLIVDSLLNGCVTETSNLNENDPDYRIIVDVGVLGSGGDFNHVGSDVLWDLISLKKVTAAKKLLRHTVIAALIDVRWKKQWNTWLVYSLIYALFLVTYTLHLERIFW